jgi:hypothetical protein
MPCHHNLETYLHEYINGAGLAGDPKALLFQTYSRATGQLTGNPLPQANAYMMIQRRSKSGKIATKIGNHTFRATGVTAYLKNGGTLENAALMANHASTRTDAALRPPRRGSDARRGGKDTRLAIRSTGSTGPSACHRPATSRLGFLLASSITHKIVSVDRPSSGIRLNGLLPKRARMIWCGKLC